MPPEGRERTTSVSRHVHWDEDIWLTGPRGKFELKIGGNVHYDLGTIHASDALKTAFAHPETIEEIRRILREHLATSAP